MARSWCFWLSFFAGISLFFQHGSAGFLQEKDIERLETQVTIPIGSLPLHRENMTMFQILGLNPTFVMPDDIRVMQKLFNATAEKALFTVFTIGEMAASINSPFVVALKLTPLQLFMLFWKPLEPGIVKAKYPIVYAAHLQSIAVPLLKDIPILNLASRITGLNENMIQKIYQIPLADFQRAKGMTFGQLPGYMNHFFYNGTGTTTLRRYYVMSFHSIATAILVHKNVTEATDDFVNDFKFLVHKIKIKTLVDMFSFDWPAGYTTFDGFSVEGVANNISGVDRKQAEAVFNTTSDFYFRNLTIVSYRLMNSWKTWTDNANLMSLGEFFGHSMNLTRTALARVEIPILYLEHLRNVSVTTNSNNKLYSFIDTLCGCHGNYCQGPLQLPFNVRSSAFERIVNTSILDIPKYFNETLGYNYPLVHYFTMSSKAVFLAATHQNANIAAKGFVDGFGYLARNANLSVLLKLYGAENETLLSGTIASFSLSITGITLAELKQALNITSEFYLNQTTVGTMLSIIGTNFTYARNLTLHGILQRFMKEVASRAAKFEQPVVYGAYKYGISIDELLGYNVYVLLSLSTDLTDPMLENLYRLSPSERQDAGNMNFSYLTTYIKENYGIVYSHKQLYTMSFKFSMVELFHRRKATEGATYFRKGVKFIIDEVSFKDIKQIYNISQISSMTVWSLVYTITSVDYSSLESLTSSTSEYYLNQTTIGAMTSLMQLTQSQSESLTVSRLLKGFSNHVKLWTEREKLPIAHNANRKGISIAGLASFTILETAVKTTLLTEELIKMQYRISSSDFQMSFGKLPMYVGQKMAMNFSVKHFGTLSFDSIANAVFINRNATELSNRFLNDFGFVARNMTMGEIEQIYGLNRHSLLAMKLSELAFFISGIDAMTLQRVLVTGPVYNETRIGEIARMMRSSEKPFDVFTMHELTRLSMRVGGIRLSMLPSVYVSHLRGISLSQMSAYTILNLVMQTTRLPERDIVDHYRLSGTRLQIIKTLTYGQLPAYVKQKVGVEFNSKSLYVMSFGSIVDSVVGKGNVTDVIARMLRDFRFIVRDVTFGQIMQIYGLTNSSIRAMTLTELAFSISSIDSAYFKRLIAPGFKLDNRKIGEIARVLSYDNVPLDRSTMHGLMVIDVQFAKALQMLRLPVVYAAFLKNITIAQIPDFTLIDLTSRLSGLSEMGIKMHHQMSTSDFQVAKAMRFGHLPAYVKQQMGVSFEVKHFYTMSSNSIAAAMLSHKNVTEGLIQFAKDFQFIMRTVTLGEIKKIYGITTAALYNSTLAQLGHTIAGNGIMIPNAASNALPNNITIKDMVAELQVSDVIVDSLTTTKLLTMFGIKITPALLRSRLPIVYAAFLKGIAIHQLPGYNIIRLASDTTGLSENLILKLYRIPANDFAAAKSLPFGHLPSYIKQRLGVDSILKHYYTMSFDSIAKAFLVHANITEAAMDFVKDFHFIANLKFDVILKMYKFSEDAAMRMRFPELLKYISDANMSHVFRFGQSDSRILAGLTIGEYVTFLKSRNDTVNTKDGNINGLAYAVIANWRQVPGFFVTLGSLKPANIMDATISNLVALANVSDQAVLHLLRKGLVNPSYFQTVSHMPFKALVARRVLTQPTRGLPSVMLMKVLLSIPNVRVFARIPFVAAGFYNGITVSQIASANVKQIAERVLGFDILTIISALKLNRSVASIVTHATFPVLSHMIRQHSGKIIDYRHLYHASFYDLLDAFFLRRSMADATKAVDTAVRFLGVRMSLHEVRVMYEMSHAQLMNSTLIDLTRNHINVSVAEISAAINITLQQERLLERVTIRDTQILLGPSRNVLRMTAENVGHQIVNLGSQAFLFFSRIDSLLTIKGLQISVLPNIKLAQLARLFAVSSVRVDDILQTFNFTTDTRNFIFFHPLANFADVWSLSIGDFAKWDVFRLFWQIKELVTKVQEPCTKFTLPCPSNARCLNPLGSIYCRCIEGFTGNGTYCYDGCSSIRCGTGATCVNVPNDRAKCRCIKPGHVVQNGKCVKQAGRVVKVTGLKLKQAFKESYKNKDSKDFKNKAAEIESVLNEVVCVKIIGCLSTTVLSLRKGSILVDYSVTIDTSYNNVTKEHVLNTSTESLKSDRMVSLGVDPGSNLGARKSDICEIGGDNCGANSKCVPGNDGSTFMCQCHDDYSKDGGECKKKSKAGLIAGLTVGILVFLILVAILVYHRHKRQKAQLQNPGEIPFEVFKASRTSSLSNVSQDVKKNEYAIQ